VLAARTAVQFLVEREGGRVEIEGKFIVSSSFAPPYYMERHKTLAMPTFPCVPHEQQQASRAVLSCPIAPSHP